MKGSSVRLKYYKWYEDIDLNNPSESKFFTVVNKKVAKLKAPILIEIDNAIGPKKWGIVFDERNPGIYDINIYCSKADYEKIHSIVVRKLVDYRLGDFKHCGTIEEF